MGTAIILLIGVLVIAGRLLVYSWVHQSPPYYVYGLAALDCFSMPFGHVAILNYAYKIMPPTLAATVGSLVNIIEYSLSNNIDCDYTFSISEILCLNQYRLSESLTYDTFGKLPYHRRLTCTCKYFVWSMACELVSNYAMQSATN